MIIRWFGDTPLADAEALAALYEVSQRSVRRHCTPADRIPRKGQRRGLGGKVLYDAYTAADDLQGVAPRPERTLAGLRARAAEQHTDETEPNHGQGH